METGVITFMETSFGDFARQVVNEFRLSNISLNSSLRLSARMADSMLANKSWKTLIDKDKPVQVWFKLQYGTKDNKKYLAFSQEYRFRDIVDSLDGTGIVQDPQCLNVHSNKLKVMKSNFEYGLKANGDEFDKEKFVCNMFRKSKNVKRYVVPKAALESTKVSFGNTWKEV